MHLLDFCELGQYQTPFSSNGRARTIAAIQLAQGNPPAISHAEMRRDVLTGLTSTSAVAYWLNKKAWLERTRKIGKVQLLRLTDAGYRECLTSLAGGSAFPTTARQVAVWQHRMLDATPGSARLVFKALSEN